MFQLISGVLSQNIAPSIPPVGEPSTGELLLKDIGGIGRTYLDLSTLIGSSSEVMLIGNEGLEDKSPNSFNGIPGNSPEIEILDVNGEAVPSFKDLGNAYIDTGHDGSSWFNTSFGFFALIRITNGLPVDTIDIFGVTNGANDRINFFITTAGITRFQYRTDTTTFISQSTNPIFSGTDTGVVLLFGVYDYVAGGGAFSLYNGKVIIPQSIISGSVSAVNPANWNGTDNVYIGSNNNSGPLSNTTLSYIMRFGVTDLPTTQQREDISDYIIGDFGQFSEEKPTIQASNLIATPGQTSMRLDFDRGDGSNILIIGSDHVVDRFPVDGIQYAADNNFSTATDIGNGNKVLYNGTGNFVIIDGLIRDKQYFFDAYEFNGIEFRYLVTIGNNTIIGGARTDFINTQDFTGYPTNWQEDGTGYTTSIVNGELRIVGNPLGYLGNIVHDDKPGVTLESFEIEIGFRLHAAPTTGTPGLGLGIKNALATEVNQGVLGTIITKTDSSNFGGVQIYSGNGTINPSGYSFRAMSSTLLTVPPALDSQYKGIFRRQVQSNNAQYAFTITDLLDVDKEIVVTTWTEINRPSSAFFATTTEFFIYQNGGSHAIDYFIVRRIGAGTTPPPEPGIADINIAVDGDDVNGDGSVAAPYKTHVKGLAELAALGGSNRSFFAGPGVYIEGSFLGPPINMGSWQGSGINITEIRGATSLNFNISTAPSGIRSNLNGFLINYSKGSTTNIDTTIKDMTLNGGSNGVTNSNTAMKGGVAVRHLNGLKLENIHIKHFNTTGIRCGDTGDLSLKNVEFEETSGNVVGVFGFYQLELWNVGGGTALGSADGNFKIVVDGCTFTDMRGDGAQTLGFVGGPGSNQLPEGNEKYITNLEIKNSDFSVNYTSQDNEGHKFCIEGLYMTTGNVWIHDNFFNSNLSLGLGNLEFSLGQTRISHNHFALDPGAHSFVIEMQISNIEIDHNYIAGALGAHNGVFVILNTQETYGNAGHAPLTRGDHGNWNIHHNIIEYAHNNYSEGLFGALRWDLKGVVIEHNTIRFNTTSGQPVTGVIVSPRAGHAMTGLFVRSNAYHGQPAANSNMFNTSSSPVITGGVCTHNKSTHFPVTQVKSGVTSNNNQIHPGGLGILFTGTKPTSQAAAFSGNYYRPSSISVLKNAGHDGTTIGALPAL